MEELNIAIATETEKEWAARLIASSEPWITLGTTLENCLWFCRHPEYLVFIAHDREEPCGAMVIHPRGLASSPYLKSIVVSEPYRDKGVGRSLLKSGEDHFRETSRNFFLCVSSFNTRARSLYERIGYQKVGELKDYIIAGESELIMYKRLK
jgi:[ribosomal protein S18]-alanine N-acetyltransferase